MTDWEEAARALAQTHGEPLRHGAVPPAHARGGFDGPREAEVCMVVRDGEVVAVMTKPFCPWGIWRLPTGGIEAGEGIIERFARELLEETGFVAPAPRFLAHVAYEVERAAVFRTLALLAEWDGAPLLGTDTDEAMTWATAGLAELEAQAERMAALPSSWSPDLEEDWAAWAGSGR